jgi:hypothetical protein
VKAKTTRALIEELIDANYYRLSRSDRDETEDALLSRIRELEADAARLNWLEDFVNRENGIVLHVGNQWKSVSSSGLMGLGLRPGLLARNIDRTLREAIDAARSPESKTEGAKP